MKITEKLSSESNREYALRVIQENIVNLELKPGSMIYESDIAKKIKLSRTPIHEALHELTKTKIVEILPQKGCRVSFVNMTLIEEAVFMRATIEAAVTEEACKKATSEDIKELEENIRMQEFYEKSDSRDKIMELDNAFHKTMYRITDKLQCHYMVCLMNIHYDRFRELRLKTSAPRPIIAEHRAIFESFKAGLCEKTKDLVKSHLNRFFTDEKEIRAKFPEYFE